MLMMRKRMMMMTRKMMRRRRRMTMMKRMMMMMILAIFAWIQAFRHCFSQVGFKASLVVGEAGRLPRLNRPEFHPRKSLGLTHKPTSPLYSGGIRLENIND